MGAGPGVAGTAICTALTSENDGQVLFESVARDVVGGNISCTKDVTGKCAQSATEVAITKKHMCAATIALGPTLI